MIFNIDKTRAIYSKWRSTGLTTVTQIIAVLAFALLIVVVEFTFWAGLIAFFFFCASKVLA